MTPLEQHQAEIQENLRHWRDKPLLQEIYGGFYRRILGQIDTAIPGRIVEIGSGIGNLKAHLPGTITTDLLDHQLDSPLTNRREEHWGQAVSHTHQITRRCRPGSLRVSSAND